MRPEASPRCRWRAFAHPWLPCPAVLLDDQGNQGGDDNQGDQDNGDDQGRCCRRIRRRYTIKENDSIEEIARSVYADFQGPLEKKINLIKYCNRELLFIN